MGYISPRLIVPRCTLLTDVVMCLWVCAHRDFTVAASALEVEPIDFNAKVVDIPTGFLSHIVLGTDVKEVAAGVTANAHGQHHSDAVLFITGTRDFPKLGGVEVWWIILNKYFSFSHYYK